MNNSEIFNEWVEFRNETLSSLEKGEADDPSWDAHINKIKKYLMELV